MGGKPHWNWITWNWGVATRTRFESCWGAWGLGGAWGGLGGNDHDHDHDHDHPAVCSRFDVFFMPETFRAETVLDGLGVGGSHDHVLDLETRAPA